VTGPLFFVLWRCALIALLGFAISQMHGWQPAPWLVLVMLGIAADSIATLFGLIGKSSDRSVLNRNFQTWRKF